MNLRKSVSILLLIGSATLFAQTPALPTPASVFGFEPGADNKLATYDQSVAYFRKLAAAAPKNMVIHEAGKTSLGRTYTYRPIPSPENTPKTQRPDRGAGQGPREGGQGVCPHRRRTPRDRERGSAADAAARVRHSSAGE